jgi:hypothetical protein
LSIRGQTGRKPGGGFLARSGDLELFVSEVSDELEGAAERGDEAIPDVLSGDVAAFDLGDAGDRDAHPGGYLFPESRQRDTSPIDPSPSLARRGSRYTAVQLAGSPYGTTVTTGRTGN